MTATISTASLARDAAADHGERPALRFLQEGTWCDRSYQELSEDVDRLAAGLLGLGIGRGDRVCILADTSPVWTTLSLAISRVGAVVVPIYPTNSPRECQWVISDSGARVVFCQDEHQVAKVDSVRAELVELESIVIMTGTTPGTVTLGDVHARAPAGSTDALDDQSAAILPHDACLIIYTSGTTGPPKGCVLTHRGFAMACELTVSTGLASAEDVVYLYLPLAHVFAQLIQAQALTLGGTIAYYSGDTKNIIAELGQVKPTILPSVPRIFEKVHSLATSTVPEAERPRFDEAIRLGFEVRSAEARSEPVDADTRTRFEAMDAELFANVRALFGGRLRYALSGAAPISADVLRFFYACGILVLESYGMTESTGLAACNLPGALRFGTVGRALNGVELRIAPDGEILLRGPMLFSGYRNAPDATAETLPADGWLRTGDLGSLDEDGFLHITGRKKEIIITAGGKNLAPANFENDLKQSRFISQAVMYADRRPYPVALVTLDEDVIVSWARQYGLPAEITALAEREEVRALVQHELDAVNQRYAPVEQVKRFTILPRDLSQEAGELTPTLKLKRKLVYERYQRVLTEIYEVAR